MQKEVWKIIEGYNNKHNIEHNPNTTFHHLIEEIGELSREIQKEKNDWRKEGFNKEKLGEELIDVLGICLMLAQDYDINIEETFKKKISKLKTRFELK